MNRRVIFSKRLVIINSASSLATRLASITVLIWVQQFLLKRVSVEEYSLLPVVASLMIFAPLFTLVLTGGIRRYVLVAFAENDEGQVTRIVSSMFPLLCFGSLLFLCIGGILAWQIDGVLRIDPEFVDDAQIMLALLLLLEAIRLPMQAFSSGLYVQQRFVLENLIKIACECGRLALLFALLLGFKVSVISVVVAAVVAGMFEVVALLIVSRRILPSQRFEASSFDWSIVRDLTRFGRWSSLYGFVGMIRKSADAIILNRLSTPLDVACFHLGALVPNRLEVIVNQSFLGPLSPVIVGLYVDGQSEKLKNSYLRLGRYAMWGVLIIIAPFLVHYEQIIRLYVGETYLSAGTVLILLLACYPIVYGNILHTSLANAQIRMRSLALRESISAGANLSLTLLLVGYYQLGAVGAAIATFIVYGLGSILLFWPLGKGMAGATWREVWREILFPGIVPFLTVLAIMKLLALLYPALTWVAILFHAWLGVSLYLVILWFVAKDVDRSQLQQGLSSLVAYVRSR